MKRCALALLAAAVFVCGCGSKRDSGDSTKESPGDKQPASAPGSDPMQSLGFMQNFLQSRMDEPGPYDEPKKSKGFDKDSDHFAVLELTGPVVELESFDWFGGTSGSALRALTKKLDDLAADEHVLGLVLRFSDLELDLATAEELRGALVAFKSAGGRTRKLICHTEQVVNTAYYVMSACDSIGLAPTGEVMITGVAAMPVHLKKLLDKLGVEADFLHVGAYKGAAEPLTRERPSKAMLETLGAILDQSYATLVAGIAEGRALEPARVRELIDTAVFQDQRAVAAGLVDKTSVYSSFRDSEIGDAEWTVVKLKDKKKSDMTSLMRFLGFIPRSRPSGPHVAVIYAVGNVVDGKGSGSLSARSEIASRPLTAAFRALAADESVKAIVFRIDSGGGSALSSEIIWHAVAEAKAVKPVIVSMGNVAASGGYYIACGATKIYALSNTLTGSIGVVGGKLAIDGALAKIGIEAFPIGRGKRALMWSSLGSWNEAEKAAVQTMMEDTYKVFVQRVADSRGQSFDQIHAIAQGRVWTGAAAKERGLVDAIGGLSAALAEARTLGGVAADAEIEVYPPEPTLLDIIGSLGEVSMPFGLQQAVAATARDLGPRPARVVDQLFRQLLQFRETPVQAALLFPVIFR